MSARRRSRRTSPEARLAQQLVTQLMRTNGGRRAFIALAIASVLALACFLVWNQYARVRHPIGPTVRIATWNLRQFSDTRKTLDVRAVAEIITSSGFDVVAIQEVKRDGEAIDRLLNALGPPWRSALLSDVTGNRERFAFIYNGERVQEIGTPHFIATAEAVIFDRVPYQHTFRAGQFDFTLITCHLYYGDDAAGFARRRKEAQALARFAQKLATQSSYDKDVIVLGDFNETRGKHANLAAFTDMRWDALNADATNLANKQVYDNLIIDPKNTREWNGHASVVKFDEGRFAGNDKEAASRVSDHRPAYADFVTNLPDDD